MPVDVLLVDDHKIMRDGIKAILERDPEFRVVGEAESGADALQFVKLHHPELVLMDIGLPGTSGHELLKAIMMLDPEAYVVMASANSFKDDVMGAMGAGAKGFVTKPFSRDKLIRAVNQSPTIKRQIL